MSISSNSSATDEGWNGDGVIPTVSELQETYTRSKRHWESLLNRASSMHLDEGVVCSERLLYRVPHFPQDLRSFTSISGVSSWDFTTKSTCKDTPPVRAGVQQDWKLSLPSGLPTICFLSGTSSFSGSGESSNALAPMCFAWSYVLCKALMESQGIDMHYSNLPTKKAPVPQSRSVSSVDMYIGKVSETEKRWWSALVAPEFGFNSDSTSRPPWTITFSSNIPIHVTSDEKTIDVSDPEADTPPPSFQAIQYISRFASIYGLENQAMLALSMALTSPLHNQTKSVIRLPKPQGLSNENVQKNTSPTSRIASQIAFLPQYITLSSNPLFLSSALWSVFWEPGVASNCVSAWSAPIHDIIQALSNEDEGQLELLAHVMALRRPTVSALWYGVLACGRTKIIPGILNYLATSHTPWICRPIPEVAAWTRSPQSFMDVEATGPYIDSASQVKRIDIWRLRYELWNLETSGPFFRSPPFCPWPPFETMLEEEAEPTIRAHLRCAHHELHYASRTWLLPNGKSIVDASVVPHEILPLSMTTMEEEGGAGYTLCDDKIQTHMENLDLTASRQSVSNIFRWSTSEMEPSGKHIYNHSWVQACQDLNMEQENELIDGADTKDSKEQHDFICNWLDRLPEM